MKKIAFLFFCLLTNIILYSFDEIQIDNSAEIEQVIKNSQRGRLFLFTYPRSGTHWTCYILKALTHRVVTVPRFFETSKFLNKFPTDLTKPPIHSNHFYEPKFFKRHPVTLPNVEEDKIMVVIRNPLECILRRLLYQKELTIEEIPSRLKKEGFRLYDTLTFFEKWPKKNRLVIYYENLIQYPEREMVRMLDFLGEAKTELADFMHNLERHKEISVNHYGAGSYTKGKNVPTYHSDQVPESIRAKMKQIIYEQNPNLFEKYFNRYFGN